jgi:hypothetical protein
VERSVLVSLRSREDHPVRAVPPYLNIPEGHDEAQFKLHNDCD